MRELLSGNESIAIGAWEAGVKVATAYPGTPSTEILETIARFKEVKAEWSTNEKVAYEVAYGSSVAGVRSMVSMKHVGLNVAADPLFTSAYAGVNAGFAVVVADDPGMHSSQNEQDSRRHAKAARIPVFEPSDPQEAHDLIKHAFEFSEQWDIPVMVRLTTRVSHTRAPVQIGERVSIPPKGFERDWRKYVMIPANARQRHKILEEKIQKMTEKISDYNWAYRFERGNSDLAFITSGIAYLYLKDAFPNATVLKLNISYPLPIRVIAEFFKEYKNVFVVEEGDPVIEEELARLGYKVKGKPPLPRYGELSADVLLEALGIKNPDGKPPVSAPLRPPALCPGCPHTGVFWALSLLKKSVMGDIGCYTLGALPPYQAMHTTIDMGASITMAFGAEKAGEDTVAVIGDSTFFHSGITGLIDIVHNNGNTTVIILDNRTTGMTGHQDHPGTGKTPQGEGHEIDIETLVKAIGVKHVVTIDPHDLKRTKRAIQEAIRYPGPSVVISKRPCALIPEGRTLYKDNPIYHVDAEKCVGEKCYSCLRVGCPAITVDSGKAFIQATLCVGCGVCEQVCPYDAITS